MYVSTAAAVDTLEITAESEAAFYPSTDANFPFNTPLVIRAFDEDGYVVTDGPDANLVRDNWRLNISTCHLCLVCRQ